MLVNGPFSNQGENRAGRQVATSIACGEFPVQENPFAIFAYHNIYIYSPGTYRNIICICIRFFKCTIYLTYFLSWKYFIYIYPKESCCGRKRVFIMANNKQA